MPSGYAPDVTAVPPEFRTAFEAERRDRLRGRLLAFAGVMIGLAVIRAGSVMVALLGSAEVPVGFMLSQFSAALATAGLFGLAAWRVTRSTPSMPALLRLSGRVVALVGATDVLLGTAFARWIVHGDLVPVLEASPLLATLIGLALLHLFAALFLPWTPREAMRVLAPVIALFVALALLVSDEPLGRRLILALAAPFAVAPGTIVCGWRHGRFRETFRARVLEGLHAAVTRDLVDARRIHEALLPRSGRLGATRLTLRYRPMRQIGGDLAFVRRGAEDSVLVVVLDVTGHGIGAALAVNRLHGELERLLGERPELGPGAVIAALDRYVALVLAPHAIFATAGAVRLEPESGRLRAAGAGHPPLFVHRAAGGLERIDSRAPMLGALGLPEPGAAPPAHPSEVELPWAPGDRAALYTDGVLEARGADDAQLGLDRLADFLERELAAVPARDAAGELHRGLRRDGWSTEADDALMLVLEYDPAESDPEADP